MSKYYLETALQSLNLQLKKTTHLAEKQLEESKMFINDMVDIKQETHCISEDAKDVKEYSTKFSSKLDDRVKKISYFTTYFDGILDNMSFNNIVGCNIEAAT